MRGFARALAVVVLALGVSAEAKNSGKNSGGGDHKEGEYGGVAPGKAGKKTPKSRRRTVTWVGFQALQEGRSRIFLQLTRDAEYTQSVDEKGILRVAVRGVRYGSKNARRRLDTRYFDTSVAAVTSKRHRGGIVFSIAFKDKSDARNAEAQLVQEQDGYHYLYLGFGAATHRGASE